METESKTPSLVWEVFFGAVFKLRVDGRHVLVLSTRHPNGNWSAASEIDDAGHVYKDLGLDQCSIVHVLRKDEQVKLRDFFAVTLDHDGDSTTAAKAAKDKVLGQLLEKIFSDWMKESGPLLIHANGKESTLWPTDLVAKYDPEEYGALRKAFASEAMEGADASNKANLEKAIERFNEFMAAIQEGDELFWFEHNEPLADRIGYCILRKGRLVRWYLTLMS